MKYRIIVRSWGISWYKYKEGHRLYGPACEYFHGHKYHKYWFINDKNYSD